MKLSACALVFQAEVLCPSKRSQLYKSSANKWVVNIVKCPLFISLARELPQSPYKKPFVLLIRKIIFLKKKTPIFL